MTNHFVAEFDRDLEIQVDKVDENAISLGFWEKVGRSLIRNPFFWVSSVLILGILAIVIVPGLFTSVDPRFCQLSQSSQYPSSAHPFGTTLQGCDVYARVIFGARPSVLIGILTMIVTAIFGGVIGAIAGYFGGLLDAVLSRIMEIFFSVPFLLGAVAILQVLTSVKGIWKMIFTLAIFGWVSSARIMRSTVLETKSSEFITFAKVVGLSKMQILFKHVIPSSIVPLIVTSTVGLSSFIVAEATLSFLGLGLGADSVSWGIDISNARESLITAPFMLIFPSLFLIITVLAFVFLGESIREALLPNRKG